MTTRIVNIHAAKTNLSELLAQALDGIQVIIAKAGKPLVELRPITQKKTPIKWGVARGKWKNVPATQKEFDACNDEIADMFYGDLQD